VLGVWGALAPFIGPYFDFAFSPDQPWVWTTGRGWLEVLPGAVAAVGGLLMFASRNRATAMFGSWMAVVAGAWFVIGRALAGPLALGDVGSPLADTDSKRVWLELTYFYGLGALIIFLGALALGRLSVRSARDIAYAERARALEAEPAEPVVAERHSGSWRRHDDVRDARDVRDVEDARDARDVGDVPTAGGNYVAAPERRRRPSLLSRFRRRRDVEHPQPV
jgi:hypothetical protein